MPVGRAPAIQSVRCHAVQRTVGGCCPCVWGSETVVTTAANRYTRRPRAWPMLALRGAFCHHPASAPTECEPGPGPACLARLHGAPRAHVVKCMVRCCSWAALLHVAAWLCRPRQARPPCEGHVWEGSCLWPRELPSHTQADRILAHTLQLSMRSLRSAGVQKSAVQGGYCWGVTRPGGVGEAGLALFCVRAYLPRPGSLRLIPTKTQPTPGPVVGGV